MSFTSGVTYQKLSSFAFCSFKRLQLVLVLLQPQMDEKIQLGPRAQVTWVKGSSGGAKASDSGETSATDAPDQHLIIS